MSRNAKIYCFIGTSAFLFGFGMGIGYLSISFVVLHYALASIALPFLIAAKTSPWLDDKMHEEMGLLATDNRKPK